METGTGLGWIEEEQVRLTIEASEPQRVGPSEFAVNLTARLVKTGRRGDSLFGSYNNLFIQFRQESDELEPTLGIDGTKGTTAPQKRVVGLEPGKRYNFFAEVLESGTSTGIVANVTVPIPVPPVILPETFDGQIITGPPGRLTVNFSVRNPAIKMQGVFTNETTGKRYAVETDASGVGFYPDPDKIARGEHELIRYNTRTSFALFFQNTSGRPPEHFPLEAPPRHPQKALPDDWTEYGFLRKWGWRFQNNNNYRWLTYCLISLVWLVVNFSCCTFSNTGDVRTAGIRQVSTHKKYQAMDSESKRLTELLREERGLKPIPEEPVVESTSKCDWSWWLWRWWSLWCFLYMFIAFSDEVGDAWRETMRKVRERREGVTRGGTPPQATATGVTQTQGGVAVPVAPATFERRSFFRDALSGFALGELVEAIVRGISRSYRR